MGFFLVPVRDNQALTLEDYRTTLHLPAPSETGVPVPSHPWQHILTSDASTLAMVAQDGRENNFSVKKGAWGFFWHSHWKSKWQPREIWRMMKVRTVPRKCSWGKRITPLETVQVQIQELYIYVSVLAWNKMGPLAQLVNNISLFSLRSPKQCVYFLDVKLLVLLFFTIKTMLGLLVYVSSESLSSIVVFFRSFTSISKDLPDLQHFTTSCSGTPKHIGFWMSV